MTVTAIVTADDACCARPAGFLFCSTREAITDELYSLIHRHALANPANIIALVRMLVDASPPLLTYTDVKSREVCVGATSAAACAVDKRRPRSAPHGVHGGKELVVRAGDMAKSAARGREMCCVDTPRHACPQ